MKITREIDSSFQIEIISNLLKDFENASPYFCNFLANRICDRKVTRKF